MSSRDWPGSQELGQNFLTNPQIIRTVVDLAARTDGPIVEWAAGDGALTLPLAELRRPLEAVEIDPCKAAGLQRRVGPHVCITEGDILRHAPPPTPFTLVSNIPFHITTPVLRRILPMRQWDTAILITQWEVARKRAGVGGATQLTAQWWPWYDFILQQRIPSTAFRPRPSVDAGLLLLRRRQAPLLDGDRHDYQQWVRRVFTSRGHGMPEILTRSGGLPTPVARNWCAEQHFTYRTLPKNLGANQWADAYKLTRRWSQARPGQGGSRQTR
jgi:23S rRNA (adenine-N6)-dimethyltransferase